MPNDRLRQPLCVARSFSLPICLLLAVMSVDTMPATAAPAKSRGNRNHQLAQPASTG